MKIQNGKGYLYCDFAFIFDLFSICEVKIENGIDSQAQMGDLLKSLKDQLGDEFTKEIISSVEYKELYRANYLTFLMVDKAKINTCLASEVDDCNTARFKAKQALQEKFFGTNLEEKKKL